MYIIAASGPVTSNILTQYQTCHWLKTQLINAHTILLDSLRQFLLPHTQLPHQNCSAAHSSSIQNLPHLIVAPLLQEKQNKDQDRDIIYDDKIGQLAVQRKTNVARPSNVRKIKSFQQYRY